MKKQASPTLGSFAQQVLDRYSQSAPTATAVRLALEATFGAAVIDQSFADHAVGQYTDQLEFSMIVDVMSAVVTRRVNAVNSAITRIGDRLPVSVQAFYQKMARTEPGVAAGLLKDTAERAGAIIREMGGQRPPLLEGRRVRVLDGNHLAATERRLEVLRGSKAGPLPGFGLVVLDPQLRLLTHVIPCEDGHQQERAQTEQILALVESGDCWIADRNFCTRAILFGIRAREGSFLIRHHAGLEGQPVGVVHARGRNSTGHVFEQDYRIEHEGKVLVVRRITVKLDAPTRDGDTELHLLTDLPASEVDACLAANLYQDRWQIETAFSEVALWLEAEIKPLGYPRAALLGFCVGLCAYNVMSVVLGALRAVHGDEVVSQDISGYHMVEQARADGGGLDALLTVDDWRAVRERDVALIAAELIKLARLIPLRTLKKSRRGPKKPVPPRTKFSDRPHVSTKRLLDEKRSARR